MKIQYLRKRPSLCTNRASPPVSYTHLDVYKRQLQYTTDDLGRVSQGAAIALAIKVSIYQKNWLKALEYTAKLKALNVYALVADYGDNFKKNTQNNSESIWEIQHTNLELGVGNSLNQWWFSKKAVGGYGFAEMTASFVSAFENDDPRRAATVAMNNEEYLSLIHI